MTIGAEKSGVRKLDCNACGQKTCRDGQHFRLVQPGCTKRERCLRRTSGGRWRRNWRERRGTVGANLFQGLQEPNPGHRAGNRDRSPDAGHGQIPRLPFGDDLRRLPGWRALGQWRLLRLCSTRSRATTCRANTSALFSHKHTRRHPQSNSTEATVPATVSQIV
jgi:hypothetical protein